MTINKSKLSDIYSTLSEEQKREREKAIKALKKMKELEASHAMYRYRFPNGMIISASTKESLDEMKAALEANK